MVIIWLGSCDGETFPVDSRSGIAKQSTTIPAVLETVESMKERQDVVIWLRKVNAATMKKVIEWCEHHKNKDQAEVNMENRIEGISSWDAKFLEVDEKTYMHLIVAALNLCIFRLLKLLCNSFTNMTFH
jgi:S-phase kinase-associated protein 1